MAEIQHVVAEVVGKRLMSQGLTADNERSEVAS